MLIVILSNSGTIVIFVGRPKPKMVGFRKVATVHMSFEMGTKINLEVPGVTCMSDLWSDVSIKRWQKYSKVLKIN